MGFIQFLILLKMAEFRPDRMNNKGSETVDFKQERFVFFFFTNRFGNRRKYLQDYKSK